MSVRLPLSALIYPRECVEQAIAAYSHVCKVEVSGLAPTGCLIDVSSIATSGLEEDVVMKKFMNFLLDLSLEAHLHTA